MDNKTLGTRLKRIRQANGLSQVQMAQALGFGEGGHPIVSKIEAGQRRLLASELRDWCRACNVSTEDVLENSPLTVQIPGEAAV